MALTILKTCLLEQQTSPLSSLFLRSFFVTAVGIGTPCELDHLELSAIFRALFEEVLR